MSSSKGSRLRTKSPSARHRPASVIPAPPSRKEVASGDRQPESPKSGSRRCCSCCPNWRSVCASPISILVQCVAQLLWFINPVRLASSLYRMIMVLYHSPEFRLVNLFVFNFRMVYVDELPWGLKLLPYALASGYVLGELLVHVSTKWLGAKDPPTTD